MEGPLFDAVLNGNYDDTIAAIQGGADVNKLDHWGNTPLFTAVEFSYFEIAKVLIQAGANTNIGSVTPLFQTVFDNQPRMTKLFLENGGDPNFYQSGATILHLAVFFCYVDIVEIILASNVNVDALDENGNTPLHYAIYKNNFPITNLLLQKGANPLIPSARNKTAIDYAKFFGNREMLKLFFPQQQIITSL